MQKQLISATSFKAIKHTEYDMLYLYAEGILNGRAYQIGFEQESTNTGMPTFSLKALLEANEQDEKHSWVVGQFFQLDTASNQVNIVDANLKHQIKVQPESSHGAVEHDLVYHHPFKVIDLPLFTW